jgi:hypothetical protein
MQVPSAHFPAPTAAIWLDMAALVNGGSLPEHVLPFCAVAAAVAAALPFVGFYLQRRQAAAAATRWEAWLPSSIGFAVRRNRNHDVIWNSCTS